MGLFLVRDGPQQFTGVELHPFVAKTSEEHDLRLALVFFPIRTLLAKSGNEVIMTHVKTRSRKRDTRRHRPRR